MRFLFAFLLHFFAFVAEAQVHSLSNQQWEEDIDFLQEKLFKTFPEADSRIDKSLFEAKAAELKKRLPTLLPEQRVVGLESLLALAKDNGCYIYPFQSALNYPLLPLKTYWFTDGLFVCDATDDYKELIGRQISEVNGIGVETIFQKMLEILPADNLTFQRYMFPMYLQIPAWLEWAWALTNSENALLTLSDGEEKTVTFSDVKDYIPLERKLASFQQLTESEKKHEGENYWMEYLPDGKTLILQFLQIRDSEKGISFKDFVKELEKELNSGKVEKLVIDNRYGGGGNGFKLKPFTDLIRDTKSTNQRGKLFVLTSRASRGTMQEMTSILQLNTKAVLIGEPTGEGPNLVGDTKEITLPNSKIKVSFTHIFWPTSFESDSRTTISPERNIVYSFSDYQQKADPWLQAVDDFQWKPEGREVPKDVIQSLLGKHYIAGKHLEIEEINGQLFLKMGRKIKSFFELNTELYSIEDGLLGTDINGVYVRYSIENGDGKITSLDWFGEKLK